MLKKKFKSFAKINLFLNVGKKFNKTGLHNIQSLVCLINLFDENPPLLYDAPDFSFDTRVHDPRGRMLNIQFELGLMD